MQGRAWRRSFMLLLACGMRRVNSRALTRIHSGAVDQAFVPGLFRASVSAFPLARKRPGTNALQTARVTASEASTFAPGTTTIDGGSTLYITGVTSRPSSVDDTSPPMITIASGE